MFHSLILVVFFYSVLNLWVAIVRDVVEGSLPTHHLILRKIHLLRLIQSLRGDLINKSYQALRIKESHIIDVFM